MAQYDEGMNSGVDNASVAGFGGLAQSIPGLNIIAPAFTAMFAAKGEEEKRRAILANAQRLGTPLLQTQYGKNTYQGNYDPTAFAGPEAAQYQLAEMDPQTLAARRAAIDQMYDAGNGLGAAQSEAARREALFDSANQAGATNAALREEMAARGKGGSGAEWAMRQRANQAGAQQAMMGGLGAQALGAQQRLAALSQYENGLGGLSDDQQALSTNNSNVVNQFNMANTNLRNQVAMANTQMKNGAQLRNLDSRQTNANQNTAIGNANQDATNTNRQNMFANELQKLAGVQNAIQGQATQFANSNTQAQVAGKIGSDNFKSLAGGMGGGMGGGGGGAGGGGGMDMSQIMGMFGGK